ncbi:ECF transporter S component [Crassaminicella indica]|uniref:ECF transporter S component n=1 Tax=Crassaminicella indica TaxID=2855394 RepID=A0ABX8RC18_9CLOT|nr:ECF transporter S component [Crassaminicella indica]QXM06598.1 ECF transporter S component [Crassaminicella indica]
MKNNTWTTRRMVLLGLFIAVNMTATYIHIPVGPSMMHLGTTTLFITALILNPIDSAIAAGGGMFLFDIFGGYFSYAPFTLVIKGLMAYVVAKIVQQKSYNGTNIKINFLGYIIGGIISLVGYYLTNVYFSGNFIAPIAKIPGSLLTTSVGLLIALPLGIQVKKAFIKVEKQAYNVNE